MGFEIDKLLTFTDFLCKHPVFGISIRLLEQFTSRRRARSRIEVAGASARDHHEAESTSPEFRSANAARALPPPFEVASLCKGGLER
jgi:hypothetical protein